MNTVIHYFTGTGNTGRAVSIIGRMLEQEGHTVTAQFIDALARPPRNIPDLTVIAFPILSWAAPALVKRYVKRMPPGEGARASIFVTRGGSADLDKEGGFAGQGIEEIEHILSRKGYDVVLSMDAGYPDSWIQAVNPPSGKEAQAIIARGDAATESYAAMLLAGKRSLYRCGCFHTAWSKMMAAVFRLLGRRLLGKTFYADTRCTSCGLCAKSCPAHAVRLVGRGRRPRWGLSCQDCCRCINICPHGAIQCSVPLLSIHLALHAGSIVLWIVLIRHAGAFLCAQMAGLFAVPLAVAFALLSGWLLFLLQVTAIDRMLFALSGLPGLRSFFGRSHTRGFSRYRAPGFRPLS
jgi:ferredoxin